MGKNRDEGCTKEHENSPPLTGGGEACPELAKEGRVGIFR